MSSAAAQAAAALAERAERVKLLKMVDLELHEALTGVIKKLLGSPKAKEFSAPVSTEVTGYYAFIPRPMDLGTVYDKLKEDARAKFPGVGSDMFASYPEKQYHSIGDFAHDVRLVFKNCFRFNPVEHHIFKDGLYLAGRFEELFAEVEKYAENPKLLDPKRPEQRVPLRTRCQLLLSDLRRNPMTEWFRRRKDWEKHMPEYQQVIRSGRPMDLDTVQELFDAGQYGDEAHSFDVDAYAKDVRLIWQNALDFNTEGTSYGIMAKLVQKVFEERLAQIKAAPAPKEYRCGPPGPNKTELYAIVNALHAAGAAQMASVIEEGYPAAVKRKNRGDGEEEVMVNIDGLDEQACATLLEKAMELAKAMPVAVAYGR